MNAPMQTQRRSYNFRRATPLDLDHVVSLAREAYADVPVSWDAARAWAANLLSNPSVACLIGERTVGFLLVMQTLWDTRPRAFVLPLFSLPGADLEPLAMVRKMAEIAKAAKCASIEMGSETGHDAGVLLQRLGAKSYPLYRLDL